MNRRTLAGAIVVVGVLLGGFLLVYRLPGYGVVVIEVRGSGVDCPCNVIVSFTYPGAPRDQFYRLESLPATIRFEFQEELAVMEQDYARLYSDAKGGFYSAPDYNGGYL